MSLTKYQQQQQDQNGDCDRQQQRVGRGPSPLHLTYNPLYPSLVLGNPSPPLSDPNSSPTGIDPRMLQGKPLISPFSPWSAMTSRRLLAIEDGQDPSRTMEERGRSSSPEVGEDFLLGRGRQPRPQRRRGRLPVVHQATDDEDSDEEGEDEDRDAEAEDGVEDDGRDSDDPLAYLDSDEAEALRTSIRTAVDRAVEGLRANFDRPKPSSRKTRQTCSNSHINSGGGEAWAGRPEKKRGKATLAPAPRIHAPSGQHVVPMQDDASEDGTYDGSSEDDDRDRADIVDEDGDQISGGRVRRYVQMEAGLRDDWIAWTDVLRHK
ncbi:hypothetical protein HK101_004118 [Irineochytrium annulatum]|nr:hypothetical protein HK101_004118 [Irineochytrium annulatum]